VGILHELGALMSVIATLEQYVSENAVGRIETLVLGVGDRSGYIPGYLQEIYPFATKGSLLESARLEVERVSGRDFYIKEITANDDP
jgi:Zn finger protein HypA/HybF involved in hydrogenase expression